MFGDDVCNSVMFLKNLHLYLKALSRCQPQQQAFSFSDGGPPELQSVWTPIKVSTSICEGEFVLSGMQNSVPELGFSGLLH